MPERKKILHVRNKFEGDLIKIWNLPSPKFSVDPIEIMEETIEGEADDDMTCRRGMTPKTP